VVRISWDIASTTRILTSNRQLMQKNGKHTEGNTCCFKELACVRPFKEVISKIEVVNTCSANMCIEHDYVPDWRLGL
jgi:hypothetical protein